MAEYILSNKAIEDLSGIWEYTCQNWSERQADIYYYLLVNTCQEIAEGKLKGRPYPEIAAGILGFRAGRHLIFYRIENKQQIQVARILHEQMDLRNRIAE